MSDTKINRGTIGNWQLHHLSLPQQELDALAEREGVERMLPLVITGMVLSDPTGRLPGGSRIRTSPLTLFEKERGYCETRNSTYDLDGPEGSDVIPDLGDEVFAKWRDKDDRTS